MKKTYLAAFAAAALSASGILAAACSSDDSSSNNNNTGGDAGPSTGDSGPSTGDGGSTLYSRLGGATGISTAVGAIVTAELKDPDIASFFAPALMNTAHVPTPTDIEQCFSALLASSGVSGGPGTYPITLANGYVCRSMAAIHAPLHISNGTFNEFVTIAAGVLQANNVATSDITLVGNALNGTASVIVDSTQPDAEAACAPANCVVGSADGGTDDGGGQVGQTDAAADATGE